MRRRICLIAISIALTSCSPGADTKSAEEAVTTFHQSMNAGQYAEIYDRSDSEMKEAASRDRFVKLLTIFREKMGSFQSGKTIGWNDNETTSGHFVTLNRDARFERGPATEQFVFRVTDNHAVLVGYHLNSDLLITS